MHTFCVIHSVLAPWPYFCRHPSLSLTVTVRHPYGKKALEAQRFFCSYRPYVQHQAKKAWGAFKLISGTQEANSFPAFKHRFFLPLYSFWNELQPLSPRQSAPCHLLNKLLQPGCCILEYTSLSLLQHHWLQCVASAKHKIWSVIGSWVN